MTSIHRTIAHGTLLIFMALPACGSKNRWEGNPGRKQDPIAGKIDTSALVDKATAAVKGAPEAPPDKEPQPLESTSAIMAQAGPVTEAVITPAHSGPATSLLANAQINVLRWGALAMKPWVLVSLDEAVVAGSYRATIRAAGDTNAQSLPFSPMVEELRTELAKTLPRLRGEPKLLETILQDREGKTIGIHDGTGWKFSTPG